MQKQIPYFTDTLNDKQIANSPHHDRAQFPRCRERLLFVTRTEQVQQGARMMAVRVVAGRVLVQRDVPRGARSALLGRDLDKQLALHLRVEDPRALLVIERVQRERAREVGRRQFARMRGERLLAAYRVVVERVGGAKREPLGRPRVMGDGVDETHGAPGAQSDGQPFGLEGAAQTVDDAAVVVDHGQMVDAVERVHGGRLALAAGVAAHRFARRIGAEALQAFDLGKRAGEIMGFIRRKLILVLLTPRFRRNFDEFWTNYCVFSFFFFVAEFVQC